MTDLSTSPHEWKKASKADCIDALLVKEFEGLIDSME